MATLLLLAFEIAPPLRDARNPSDQSHKPCGRLEMGQKGHEVNRRGRLAGCGSRSSLRHSGFAHVFNDPRASLQKNWIVRLGAVSIAPESEAGIEGKPGLDLGSRFIQSP
jgi:hypothetical protein